MKTQQSRESPQRKNERLSQSVGDECLATVDCPLSFFLSGLAVFYVLQMGEGNPNRPEFKLLRPPNFNFFPM